MMFVRSFVSFIACIIVQFVEGDENVAHYLTNRSDFVSSSLKGTRKIFGNGITVEFYDLQPLPLQKTYKHALAFSIFNVTHLVMDTDIYTINNNYKLQALQSVDENSEIKFAKATTHQNLGIVAFAFANGLVTIYGKTKTDVLTFFHSIKMESCNDIHFFEDNSDLFMAVASDATALEVKSPLACRGICIFKWNGAHFDQVYQLSTLNAVGVNSLPSDEGRIIVVLGKKQPSVAFIFKNNTLHKLQNLKTTSPSEIISYEIEGNYHIVILDGSLYNTYLYNGVEFLKSTKCLKANKIYLNPNNNNPTVFATENSKLTIYQPTLTGETFHNITIDLNKNHTNSSTIIPIFQNEDYALLVFESTKSTLLPFSVYFNRTIGEPQSDEEADDLLVCLKTLGSVLESETKTKSRYTKAKIGKSAIVGAAAFGNAHDRLQNLKNYFRELKESAQETQLKISKFMNNPDLGDASIKGSLIAESLETASLRNVSDVNNKTWEPNSWLFYHGRQVLTAPAFARTIVVKNLTTSPNDPTFKDLLQHSNTQTLTGNNEFLNLKASEIICNVVNEIPFNSLYLKSQRNVIKGKKIFDTLQARNVTVTTINKKPPYEILHALSDSKMYDFKFAPRLNIQNLTFKEINGVNWDEFSNSIFRKGKSTIITGNLKISELSVENLKATSIDGVKISDFFTKNTDQAVDSTIHFKYFDVMENFNCSKMNGIDVEKEIIDAKPGAVVVVKGPVSIKNLKPFKKLYINSSKPGFRNTTESNPKLLQVYHEKVKITGNVEVNTVSLSHLAEVIVNGRQFQTAMLWDYWLKNHVQTIPVHVTFEKGVSVPQLNVRSLNNIDVKDYLVQNVDNEKAVHLYFENLTVFGDVFLNPWSQHWPDLKEIQRDSVRHSGRHHVKGKKVFAATVIVEHLKTTSLDNIDLSKAVNKNTQGRITGRKIFESIEVLKDLEANTSVIDNINDVNLTQLQNEVLYVDEEASLPLVYFNDLNVQNLKVNQINKTPINQFIINKSKSKQPNDTIVSISLEGNITINNATLGQINGIAVNQIMMKMLNNTFVVPHEVHIPGNVKIKHLHAAKINDVNINAISKRLLYRNYEQVVTAPFTFNNVITDNLYAARINNISLNHLTETDSNIVNPKNITLNNVKYIKKLITQEMSCDIEKAIQHLENPSNMKWKTVKVMGDVKILDKKSDVINVLENIVTTTSKNTITAPVIFDKRVFANIITTTGSISGVNVTKIANDAIFSTVKGKPIIITGKNTFQVLKSTEVTVHGNAAISKVNNITVRKVNSSIVYKDLRGVYMIKGKKTFLGGLQTNHLYTQKIAGLKPEDLVNLDNLRVIPNATFDRLVVRGNMNIENVDAVNFEWFFKNRVLCRSKALQILEGTYHFENVLLNNSVLTTHLNHVPTEDIVTDDGNLQTMESEKIFLFNVTVAGNINVDLLNAVNVTQIYESSVLATGNQAINGSLKIKSNSSVSANLNVQTLNGVPIERLKYILNFHDPEIVATSAGNTMESIGRMVEQSLKSLKFLPDKFMYIQEVNTLQASLPPSQDIRILQLTENSTMLLLDGQTYGSCGLPSNCPCPIEHTVYFGPGPGKITIKNNTNHRIFKYNEGDWFVSLSVEATSVSSYCRNNMSKVFNEHSLLSWRNMKTGLKGSKNIIGYLSGAEFFSSNGYIYIVLCKYYDPLYNTHELFCTLYKNNEEGDFEDIQNIPVYGAWKSHLLYTAQGVVLIIGNVVPGVSNYTDIYRFNPVEEAFDHLRTVKTIGCTAAAGVVLETDSLIILAQPDTPVHILKYDSTFDNYYYYQSFSMDYPVFSVSVFYTGGFGISDAFLSIVTSNGAFYIYSFNEIEGWKLESSGGFEELTNLIPIEMNKMSYLFAPSSKHTRLLAIVKQSYV